MDIVFITQKNLVWEIFTIEKLDLNDINWLIDNIIYASFVFHFFIILYICPKEEKRKTSSSTNIKSESDSPFWARYFSFRSISQKDLRYLCFSETMRV